MQLLEEKINARECAKLSQAGRRRSHLGSYPRFSRANCLDYRNYQLAVLRLEPCNNQSRLLENLRSFKELETMSAQVAIPRSPRRNFAP